jgi:itaconyl-CoA hydratase
MPTTGKNNYFEDFTVGDVYEHVRGRTVTHFDNYTITHMSMNTAQPHFNVEYSQKLMDGAFPERLVAGPCTIALVIGLTTEDMTENAFMDMGLTALKLPGPVFAGDTLYAKSEVLEVRDSPDRQDAGVMRYRFTGRKGDGKVVAEGERIVLVKKRSHWAKADGNAGVPA